MPEGVKLGITVRGHVFRRGLSSLNAYLYRDGARSSK